MGNGSRESREINLCQEGTVHLKLSSSGVLLSLEWYPQDSNRQTRKNSGIFDEVQFESVESSISIRERKKIQNIQDKYCSSVVDKDDLDKLKDYKKQLKQSLIYILNNLDKCDIVTMVHSILDASEIRKLPTKQPQMSTMLVSNLYGLGRLHELISYLEKFAPDVKRLVDQKMVD